MNRDFGPLEKAIIGLGFLYNAHAMALEVLNILGDEKSVEFIGSIESEWEASGTLPDLSHETETGQCQVSLTEEQVVNACSGILDAYDAARSDSSRDERIQLRATIEAIYSLRDFARSAATVLKEQPAGLSKASLLNRPLGSFPLRPAQTKSLGAAGYRTLGDLYMAPAIEIMGRGGLSAGQVSTLDDILENYILAYVALSDIPILSKLSNLGTTLVGDHYRLQDKAAHTWLKELPRYFLDVNTQLPLRTTRRSTDKYGTHYYFGWESFIIFLDDKHPHSYRLYKKFLSLLAEAFGPNGKGLPPARRSHFDVWVRFKFIPDWEALRAHHKALKRAQKQALKSQQTP